MIVVPLLIEFAPQTSLYRERDLVPHLPIVRNGPAGTFGECVMAGHDGDAGEGCTAHLVGTDT